MNQSVVAKAVLSDLKKKATHKKRSDQTRFFKEPIVLHGVGAVDIKKIAATHWQAIKNESKLDILKLADQLVATGIMEEQFVGFNWARRLSRHYTKQDFALFEKWLKKYATNWAAVDDLSTHLIAEILTQFPELVAKTRPWRTSRNRWVRRGSAVCLFYPVIKGAIPVKEVFDAADALIKDGDDLVQKGYGWALKVSAKKYPKEVFAYMMKRKDVMPRTALRYAIEKMPSTKKMQVMN